MLIVEAVFRTMAETIVIFLKPGGLCARKFCMPRSTYKIIMRIEPVSRRFC